MEHGVEDSGKREQNKQPQPPQRPQPQQQQKCPRCDSLNTKFCYYNNYSLSQPRYYCKSCKRYWTQGGTLRNIPVGGSRKGKLSNKSSSSSSHKPYIRSSQPHHHQSSPHDHEVVQNQSNLVGPSPPTMVPPIGGYLSSLAAVHPLIPPSHSLNLGFNNDVVSIGSQQHRHSQILLPSSGFYQIMVKGGDAGEVASSLYPSPQQGLIIPASMRTSGASSHSFMNDDACLWSTVSTTTSISVNNSDMNIRDSRSSSSTLIPKNHWPHLPGYDPPPAE